jgi:hypothetical protein
MKNLNKNKGLRNLLPSKTCPNNEEKCEFLKGKEICNWYEELGEGATKIPYCSFPPEESVR